MLAAIVHTAGQPTFAVNVLDADPPAADRQQMQLPAGRKTIYQTTHRPLCLARRYAPAP